MTETMTPQPILQMLQGAHVTAVVRAAIELRLFDKLAEVASGGDTSAAAVARAVQGTERGTTILLDALCALGLLVREAGSYRLSELAAAFLCTSSDRYVGDAAGIFASRHLSPHLDGLTDAVVEGGCALDRHAQTPDHPFWHDFATGSASMAGPGGHALADILKPWLSGQSRARVLDVACGSGLYGYALATRYPHVHVTSQDWPGVLKKTAARAAQLGIEGRTRLLPGDLFSLDLDGVYEVVIASHLFHHFDGPSCESLMGKLADAVAPGGRLVIHDFVTGDASPADDPAPYLFSALMLSWTRAGQSYSRSDYQSWLAASGLGHAEAHPGAHGGPSQFLVATRD